MAAAVQPVALLSMEQYLQTSYRPDCDFVDGCLEERNVGEREHSILQIAIGSWFFSRRKEWNITVMAEQRTRVSNTRVRLPDICLLPADAPKEKVTFTAPLLAIDLLSPEDRMNRVILRLRDFEQMGIPNIWLIDPVERTAFVFANGGLRLSHEQQLRVANSPVYLDLPEVFEALD